MSVVASQTEEKQARPAAARPAFLPWLILSAPLLFIVTNAALYASLRMRPWWLFEFIDKNYAFNTLVMPGYLTFCGVVGLLCVWRRPVELRKLKNWSVAAIVAATMMLGARLWASGIEPNLFQVRRVTISTPKLTAPIRILHISDIQSDAIGRREERAFAIMRGLNPDLVIVTGDLLQPLKPATIQSEAPKLDRLLRSLTPRLGIVTVGGDVDGPILDRLEQGLGGMHLLADEDLRIETGDGRLNLHGLRVGVSRSSKWSRPEVQKWFEAAAPNDFTILIGHGPDYVLSSSDLPIDLCLAGHTHGGQIRLPFYGPPVTFTQVPREMARGFHKVGRTRLNVSAGLGGEHLAGIPIIRVNCPPEMTLIELQPK